MPWKLFYFLFIAALFAIFSAFNLHNYCNVHIVIGKFENIPIYIAMLFAFLIGCIILIPFFIETKRYKKAEQPVDNTLQGIQTVTLQNKKRKWFGLGSKNNHNIPENAN